MANQFSFSRVLFAALLVYRWNILIFATDFYVAPNASAKPTPSAVSRIRGLQTANQPAAVQPGDTIWLRGGTYTGAPWTSHLKEVRRQSDHRAPVLRRARETRRNHSGDDTTLAIMGSTPDSGVSGLQLRPHPLHLRRQ
jgi:hypothetical protein